MNSLADLTKKHFGKAGQRYEKVFIKIKEKIQSLEKKDLLFFGNFEDP